MPNKRVLTLGVLALLFAGALFFALFQMQHSAAMSHDLPNMLDYTSDRLVGGSAAANEPPLAFIVLSGLSTCGVPLIVGGALLSALGVFTMYSLTKRLMGDDITPLIVVLFSVYSSAAFLLVYMGYFRHSFALTLTPLAVMFFWRALQSPHWTKYVTAGLFLGIVGLTHQIAFGSLVIAYLSYVGFLAVKQGKIPKSEVKVCIIVVTIAVCVAGAIYARDVGGVMNAGGEMGDEYSSFYRIQFFTAFTSYFEPILLSFGLVGAIVAAIRQRPYEIFILAWLLSSFVLTMSWTGYTDRFEIQMVIPLALMAGNAMMFMREFISKHKAPDRIVARAIMFGFVMIVLFNIINHFTVFDYIAEPLPTVSHHFALEVLPISLIAHVFSGYSAAVLKLVVGVPLTVAMWVLITKLVYREVRRAICENKTMFKRR
jgi:hypothetical protein